MALTPTFTTKTVVSNELHFPSCCNVFGVTWQITRRKGGASNTGDYSRSNMLPSKPLVGVTN